MGGLAGYFFCDDYRFLVADDFTSILAGDLAGDAF
jgi:hypothetical protein